MIRIEVIAISGAILIALGVDFALAAGAPPPPRTDAPNWVSVPSLSNTGNFNVS